MLVFIKKISIWVIDFLVGGLLEGFIGKDLGEGRKLCGLGSGSFDCRLEKGLLIMVLIVLKLVG